jgi:hypothetical protein
MRDIMGDFARNVASETAPDYPQPSVIFKEFRDGYNDEVEYRSADYPLALGEAIMMNHALFSGLLYAGATPITDDPFHNRALSVKLDRASKDPAVQQIQSDRLRSHGLKADMLAAAMLTDTQLPLPVLSPELPLEEVLEYRQCHDAELRELRDELGWMARRIEADPLSEEFAQELDHKTIPDIADKLNDARKMRDAWVKSKRGRLALGAAGITLGTASVVLGVFVAPLTPIVLAVAGLSLASGTGVPGMEWLLDWRDGKKNTVSENGLHYLLKT